MLENPVSRGFTYSASPIVSEGGGISAGTINAPELVDFNTITPFYFTANPNFLTEQTATIYSLWGSFDGSTNAPKIYPTGTSLDSIEGQVLQGGTSVPVGTWSALSVLNGGTNTTSVTTP